MADITPSDVFEISKSAALVHFQANVSSDAAAEQLADRLAAGITSGYARATLDQRRAWLSLGQDALRAAAVQIANLGLNPDPGAKEVYIFPRGGQLIVSPTPEAVRTMLRRADYDVQVYLCGPHDADGIDVRAGRVVSFEPGRQPLDWVASPTTCIGARVLVIDTTTGESVIDSWAPVAIIERHRAGKSSGPWSSQWDEMAVKTMQLRAVKYMPKDRLSSYVVDAVRAEVEYIESATTEQPAQTTRRTVVMPTAALSGPAPESRQIAASPDIQTPQRAPAEPVATTPEPSQAARSAQAAKPTAPGWLTDNKAAIADLAAAAGVAAPTTLATAKALLAGHGITDPGGLPAAALAEAIAAAIAEARVLAAERGPESR